MHRALSFPRTYQGNVPGLRRYSPGRRGGLLSTPPEGPISTERARADEDTAFEEGGGTVGGGGGGLSTRAIIFRCPQRMTSCTSKTCQISRAS